MKTLKAFTIVVFAAVMLASLQIIASGQTPGQKVATIRSGGTSVRWEVAAQHAGVTVTVSAPDGQVFRKEFPAGFSPEFLLSDKDGNRFPDGQYVYELRLTPILGAGVKEALAASRGKGDDSNAVREMRKLGLLPSQPLVESGGFAILNGSVIVAGAAEEPQATRKGPGQVSSLGVPSGNTVTRLRNHRLSLRAIPDQVIPDDLIVQGSACVGLDCVNNENFGFDTIRVKENNTRIQFDDTSGSGFATNNWQIRANSSASGGASFLAFVDQGSTGNSETGTIVLEVDAGAPANSLRVSSAGKLGIRTATPVLDVHANSTDTPAIRLEQNNSGGFTAQTWDVASNEANFFVRDVTAGSRLPFRIRPGAPTSSLDISSVGNVGIGTGSPLKRLHVGTGADTPVTTLNGLYLTNQGDTGFVTRDATNDIEFQVAIANAVLPGVLMGTVTNHPLVVRTNLAERMRILANGRVGIGTTAPDQVLSVNGDASKVGGGSWQIFSDERLKNIKGRFTSGLSAVMRLQPIRYEYKSNNALGLKSEGDHVGFGAQALQQVIPEAVTKNADGYLMVNNDPIIWTMLNAIKEQQNAIKEQQKEIGELKAEVQKLRAASHRRRK
jgi:hypothetical protein